MENHPLAKVSGGRLFIDPLAVGSVVAYAETLDAITSTSRRSRSGCLGLPDDRGLTAR